MERSYQACSVIPPLKQDNRLHVDRLTANATETCIGAIANPFL